MSARRLASAAVLAVCADTILAASPSSGTTAGTHTAPNVPYLLDGPLPASAASPAEDAAAPYTPVVHDLISQLLPDNPPTLAELQNAARLFEGEDHQTNTDAACHGVGVVEPPTGTTPSIGRMCWAAAVGVNVVDGPNQGRTTAAAEPLALASSFDAALNNAWGQVEGAEGRQTVLTGIYGPEADVAVEPNWERGPDTLGEEPILVGTLAAAQVSGVQSQGLMAQVKHLAGFTGADRFGLTQVQDPALHETVLPDFQATLQSGGAASVMCAYEQLQDTSSHLPAPSAVDGSNPYGGAAAGTTWPLGETHWSCEQPLTLDYALRDLWHSDAFVGSDYPATHSTSFASQGLDQEFYAPVYLGQLDPPVAPTPVVSTGVNTEPTGDACSLLLLASSCGTTGAQHVGGVPGAGCPANGCGLVDAVFTHNFPLPVFQQMLARVLCQEQRFGLLGCADSPRSTSCTNPGGVAGDISGNASIPMGPASGATAARLGTKDGDAAVAGRSAEEGAVLLKNASGRLPLGSSAVANGVSVSSPGAEYLIASPSSEASTGYPDRDAVSPLDQLRALSGKTAPYTPALSPTGTTIPSSALSTTATTTGSGLDRVSMSGAQEDPQIDFTTVSGHGQLPAGAYTWTGFLDVPTADHYVLRVQDNPGTQARGDAATLTLDEKPRTLAAATSPYCGQYQTHATCVPASPTVAGLTQAGLTNEEYDAGTLAPEQHRLELTFDDASAAPASFRFAYSRDDGDAKAAAAAATGKAAAVVFANDNAVPVDDQDGDTPPTNTVSTLPDADVRLIDAVAAANPHTVVVLNTAGPVVVAPWADNPHVTAVLEMWNAGSEGGTATARLLLGQADPSGNTPETWPVTGTDTPGDYDQLTALYQGDTPGRHPERLNGAPDPVAADCAASLPTGAPSPCKKTVMSQGSFSGYRYYDQENLATQYPFGYGLSYTSFADSGLASRPSSDGGTDVAFSVWNTGTVTGSDVAQVYVGPGLAPAGVQQAVRSLQGFALVTVAPGQTQRVTVHLPPRAFQYWDETTQRWRRATGSTSVYVGDADTAARLPLRTTVKVQA